MTFQLGCVRSTHLIPMRGRNNIMSETAFKFTKNCPLVTKYIHYTWSLRHRFIDLKAKGDLVWPLIKFPAATTSTVHKVSWLACFFIICIVMAPEVSVMHQSPVWVLLHCNKVTLQSSLWETKKIEYLKVLIVRHSLQSLNNLCGSFLQSPQTFKIRTLET